MGFIFGRCSKNWRLEVGFRVFVKLYSQPDAFGAVFVSVECCKRQSGVGDFKSEVETSSGSVSGGQRIEDVKIRAFV